MQKPFEKMPKFNMMTCMILHSLHDAQVADVGHQPILYKDDVASAFLNLPTHPIWQIQQVTMVNGKFNIVHQLVMCHPVPWGPTLGYPTTGGDGTQRGGDYEG